MDKQNYRVGSTPVHHNGRYFSVGEPVALTAEEAKALQGHVTLDPVQADPPAPPAPPAPAEPPAQAPAAAESPAQAPTAEPASAPAPAAAATETAAQAPAADAPKAEAKGKTTKSGDKA